MSEPRILTLPVPQRLPEPGMPGMPLRAVMNARITNAAYSIARNGAIGEKDIEVILRLVHRLASQGVAPVRMVEVLAALDEEMR